MSRGNLLGCPVCMNLFTADFLVPQGDIFVCPSCAARMSTSPPDKTDPSSHDDANVQNLAAGAD